MCFSTDFDFSALPFHPHLTVAIVSILCISATAKDEENGHPWYPLFRKRERDLFRASGSWLSLA